jgi:hypothetical protein
MVTCKLLTILLHNPLDIRCNSYNFEIIYLPVLNVLQGCKLLRQVRNVNNRSQHIYAHFNHRNMQAKLFKNCVFQIKDRTCVKVSQEEKVVSHSKTKNPAK